MKLSKANWSVVEAYNRGYRMINNKLINPKGNEVKGCLNKNGYRLTKLRKRNSRENLPVVFHKLTAYQKFGNKIFAKGIEVRHLDANRQNNSEDNIEIGYAIDNHLDKPELVRQQFIIAGASTKRKFTDLQMKQIRNDRKLGMSYKELMNKYQISSKGTLSYIINVEYITKK